MARAGGVVGLNLRRWVIPAAPTASSWTERGATQTLAKRRFAQERPQDSSTSNWGTGEPPIDEKATERGVAPESEDSRGKQNTDEEGQVPTPNLTRQKSTRDFINTKREERMNAAQGSKPVEEVDPEGAKIQEEVKRKGAPPAEMGAS